jgi:hypothetical protein
MGCNALTLNV